MANVLHRGHQRIIVPLPQTSDSGAIILRRLKLQADIVYIDAAHEHLPVLQDCGTPGLLSAKAERLSVTTLSIPTSHWLPPTSLVRKVWNVMASRGSLFCQGSRA